MGWDLRIGGQGIMASGTPQAPHQQVKDGY
jgi:hypothetical protein